MRVDVLVIAGKKLTLNVLIVNVLFAVVINLALHSNAQRRIEVVERTEGSQELSTSKAQKPYSCQWIYTGII